MSNEPIYDQTRSGSYGKVQVTLDKVTPNVKVENPNIRRKLTTALGVVGAVLGAVLVADLASPAFDLSTYTDPITAVVLWLGSYYGIAITLPNTPKRS